MIRCKEVAKLLSSDQFSQQGLLKRVEATLHLWMCRYCSRFAQQIKQLRSAAHEMSSMSETENEPEQGREDLETRLLRKLSEKNK